MYNIIKHCKSLSRAILSKRFPNMHLYIIFWICSFNFYSANSQCSTPDGNALPQTMPNCDLGAVKKCIKLKFHFVHNYDTGAVKTPSNQLLSEILSYLNIAFGAGNIQFTNGENCLNIIDLPNAKQDSIKFDLLVNGKPKTGFPWFYDTSAVNIFFYNNGSSSYAYGQNDNENEYLTANLGPNDVAHEMGHIFSLFHTFANTNWRVRSTWECIGGSATLADKMIDTEADPYNMDLDGTVGEDKLAWDDGCTQKTELLSKMDNCGKSNWNIPLENAMSYYYCNSTFSQCQLSAMYNHMITNFGRLMVNCDDSLNQSCNDIIINTKVEWAKNKAPYPSGVLELCPNQKIIITPSGSLTLSDFKLTKKNYTNCQDLAQNWGGIFIQGGSYVPITTPPVFTEVGDTSPVASLCKGGNSLGALYALCGSVIEYSNHGIQAPSSAGEIVLNSATMIHNLKSISCINSIGGVKVDGSLIDASDVSISRHLETIGSPFKMNNSHIKGANNSSAIGLYSYQGLVFINANSIIDGFKTGVYKDQNAAFAPLTIKNSKIYSNQNALINFSQKADIMHNEIDGTIQNNNLCFGLWYNNKFGPNAAIGGNKLVHIRNPQQLQYFKKNYFDNFSSMQLYENNGQTNALCNTWKTWSNGVNGKPTSIKQSWGTKNSPSGNIWEQYRAIFFLSQEITNYHTAADNTKFTYYDPFKGENASTNLNTCSYYSGFTGSQTDVFLLDCNESDLNQEYQQLNTQLNSYSPGPDGYTTLQKQEIDDLKTKIGEVFYRAIPCIDSNTSTYSLWYNRFDQKTQAVLDISKFWKNEDFASIINYTNIPSADAFDFLNLKNAAIILNGYKINGRNITKLNPYEVHELKLISLQSQGDFNEELRSWLFAYYGIQPVYINPEDVEARSNHHLISSSKELKSIQLLPNPTDDCFYITDESGHVHDIYDIQIFTLEGVLLLKQSQNIGTNICLKSKIPSGLYLAKVTNTRQNESVIIKIILNK